MSSCQWKRTCWWPDGNCSLAEKARFAFERMIKSTPREMCTLSTAIRQAPCAKLHNKNNCNKKKRILLVNLAAFIFFLGSVSLSGNCQWLNSPLEASQDPIERKRSFYGAVLFKLPTGGPTKTRRNLISTVKLVLFCCHNVTRGLLCCKKKLATDICLLYWEIRMASLKNRNAIPLFSVQT